MQTLIHPAGRLESLAAVGQVLSNVEVVDAIEAAARRGLYAVPAWEPVLVGPHIGLVDSRVRYRVGPNGITDEHRWWLASERDELIWRMRVFGDRATALSFNNGELDLGLPSCTREGERGRSLRAGA